MADTVLFESILTDADCHAAEPGAKPGWILKFGNGAILRAEPGAAEALKGETVWWVGRKYRVMSQKVGIIAKAQTLIAELVQEESMK
ncbi:MAG: hypothetical protein ABFD52_00750 [Acidobacteriota bacterium]